MEHCFAVFLVHSFIWAVFSIIRRKTRLAERNKTSKTSKEEGRVGLEKTAQRYKAAKGRRRRRAGRYKAGEGGRRWVERRKAA